MASIVLLDSRGERRVEVVDRVVIGRDPKSDVAIDDPMVSLRHAEICKLDDGYELRDLGSRHGTYVRETRVRTVRLTDGDEILLGVHRLRFDEIVVRSIEPCESLLFDDSTPPLGSRVSVAKTHFRPAREIVSDEEVRTDYEKLRAAFEISALAGVEREVRPLLERILNAAVSVMGAERAAAVLVDPETGTPFLRLAMNEDASRDPVSLSTKLLGEVLKRRQGVMVGGPIIAGGRSESMAAQRIRVAMCAPLLYRDQVLGVLYVDSRIIDRRFHDKDLELLVAFANQAAGALKAALTIEEVERVRSEERTRLEQVMRHMPDGVLLLDADGRIALANEAATRLLPLIGAQPGGALRESIGGRPLADLVDGGVHRVQIGTGPRRILEVAAAKADDAGALVVVVRDVTDDRRREEEAERQERLAMVGRLVAGVAHDFNNLLTVILTSADDIVAGDSLADAREGATIIAESGMRAARLTRQLLSFSSARSGTVEVVDVGRVVDDMVKLWQRLLAGRMTIRVLREAQPAMVRIDRSHLEQVLLNLVVNARDATRVGGNLSFEVRSVAGQDPHDRMVEILARDDGSGMAPEVAEHIFEPFFSTKGEAGTGLGLATVHKVVRGAGGTIAVTSQPGQGAIFRILLPASDADRTAQLEVHAITRRQATILLVEDHDAVREAAARALRGAGHTVLAAGDAEEALHLADASTSAIDLLVTDLVLPGMPGRELARELNRRRPGTRTLFISGYFDDDSEAQPIRAARFLAKPFGGESLVTRVGEVLAMPVTGGLAQEPGAEPPGLLAKRP